ncbi:hypothetical protein HR11_04900 [Porphyromonas macacae]|uniref:Mfa1 family fimbria major subunit n=1 Tax=Porphyromonas macacae TaxID=28115 RepID=UPI00052BCD2B|nr:Mfa1 family fimbria major subunit [Porphyromonas macacae]KGN99577.1 hypothetical protein HR11_04900 [Porphyromonas macacae]
MKLNRLLLGGAIALGLMTSCNKETPNQNEQEKGTTHMSVSLKMPADATSAFRSESQDHNGIGFWEGKDAKLKVTLYMVSDGNGQVETQELDAATAATSTQDGKYKFKAFKTTPGNKTIYVVINNGGAIKTALDSKIFDATAFKKAYQEAYIYAKANQNNGGIDNDFAKVEGDKDIILMSGKPVTKAIEDKVTKEQADSGSKNHVNLIARRTVARVITTQDKNIINAIKDQNGTNIGTLEDIKWTVAQYEKTTYLSPQLTDGEDATDVKKVKSPNYDYVPNNDYREKAAEHYAYDLLPFDKMLSAESFERTSNLENVKNIVAKKMQFITETTHKYGESKGDKEGTGYRKGNTPYALIEGVLNLKQDAMAKDENFVKGQDVYFGTRDRKFYMDLDKARKANGSLKSPGEKEKDNVITYKNGKVYYIAWLNPDDTNHTKWTNSPVLRNNIYHINIKSFKMIGHSGNPFDPTPEDPKKPTPPDPDDPKTPDPDDPIFDTETYMSAEITVLNWGVHSYDIDFDY